MPHTPGLTNAIVVPNTQQLALPFADAVDGPLLASDPAPVAPDAPVASHSLEASNSLVASHSLAAPHAPVAYRLVRSKRRTLSIGVDKGNVTVRAPLRLKHSLVQRFIDEKTHWINRQLAVQRVQLGQTLQIADGTGFTLFGDPCQIVIKSHDLVAPRRRSRVNFTQQQLHIDAAASESSEAQGKQNQRLFCRWLKSQVPAYMNRNTQALAQHIELADQLGEINYRYTRTKWGHCTGEGNIQYNPSIALAPLFVVDYIIAHEVCHLRHRNHSKRYWKLVASVCPNWQQAEAWLDNDGHRISIGA